VALKETQSKDNQAVDDYQDVLAVALVLRGLAFRDLGSFADAAADIRRALALREGVLRESAQRMFATACCHPALAGLAGRPGSGVSAAEGEHAASKAMEWLGRAAAAGFRNTNAIRTDSALGALRGRADFRKLVAGLEPNVPAARELAPPPRENK
jgi:hypothetical protein